MLLKLLESFPQPLLTIPERDLSIHSHNFEMCKQLLLQKVPLTNRKIFFYIISFLKELQKNNVANHLEDKLLGKNFQWNCFKISKFICWYFFPANVFSQVMCRTRNEQYAQRFLLQFLTNDVKALVKQEIDRKQ